MRSEKKMKVAVIGSRNIILKNLEKYISDADEIVSGGARGVDSCAEEYARKNGLRLTEFLPQYEIYGRGAPIIRNRKIVDYAEKVIAFWDGVSKGTESVIKYAEKVGKPCIVIMCNSSKGVDNK